MEDTELREKAHNVCADYVGGVWKSISPDDIVIERFTGGFLNCVAKLSLPVNCESLDGEPRHLIMKNALNKFGRGKFDLMTENIIVVLLAEKKIAPKVMGIYDGGRLDYFVPSRLLKPQELHNPYIIEEVARILARIHSMTPPVSKSINTKFDNLYHVMVEKILNDPRNKIKDDVKRQSIFKRFLSLNPKDEVEWIFETRTAVNSPKVFCHGDLLLNNILLCDDSSNGIIQLVDYEMSAYNYRGSDFGSFFRSFCFDYFYPEPPYIKSYMNEFPSVEEQKRFFRIYLEELQKETKNYSLDLDKEEKILLEEFKIFTLQWNFGMMLFGLENPEKYKGKMEFLFFGEVMMDAYIKQKTDFYSN